MRQSLSLSRPATVKLLHITLRTLHNWESGKVRIPYAAFKLIRLFSSYPIFQPIWKDWRIVGSRLITPEGHSLEAGNFHWLSLMARKAEAFTKINQQLRQLTASVQHGKITDKGALLGPCLSAVRDEISPLKPAFALGLVFNSTSETFIDENQQIQGSHRDSLERFPEPLKIEREHNHPTNILNALPVRLHRAFLRHQLPTGGAL